MNLSRYTIEYITSNSVQVPDESMFLLPEKVLQFGSGNLLRALPDHCIDKANRQGIFNGRVVVVESTPVDVAAFDKQDCLFTTCLQTVEEGNPVSAYSINSSISRMLQSGSEWQQVLECAHNPELKIVIFQIPGLEVGLVNDDVRLYPPRSFSGKLLAFLQERFKAFGGSSQSGMVLLPVGQEPENGSGVEAALFELAHLNGLEDAFIGWLEGSTIFCHSLAKLTVHGAPDEGLLQTIENTLGYRDDLMIVAEADHSWIIKGNEDAARILSFAAVDESIVITATAHGKGMRHGLLTEERQTGAGMATGKSSAL